MSDVDRLLSEYIAEHRAGGEANPRSYLERVEGAEREELAALIDGYLQRAPAAEWDPEAFKGSAAAELTASLHRSLTGRAGAWPVMLPRLRDRAEVMRSELVERLANELGHPEAQEKVEGYYHEMEQGTLDAEGVSGRVLEVLAGIVGSSAEALRSAGRRTVEALSAPAEGEARAFARKRSGGGEGAPAADAAPAGESRAPQAEWDEVDELFRGG